MVTRSQNRSSSSNRSTAAKTDKSAFSWGAASMVGAAIGGAALAIAANFGRKAAIQDLSAAHGDWAESLAAEHQAVLLLFDKMLATSDDQKMMRSTLLMKLGHALDKHAYAEEHVVYSALREANQVTDAEHLETEHGAVKEFLYRLSHMKADDPQWIATVKEFRDSVAAHAKMEEEQVFPALRDSLDEELNKRLTAEVNKAGFMMA